MRDANQQILCSLYKYRLNRAKILVIKSILLILCFRLRSEYILRSKSYPRDTVFLYPKLENSSFQERIDTLELINQITAIVKMANHELRELVDGGNFSYVNCMPNVHMECVSDVSTNFDSDGDNYKNIRICIAQFDQYDYLDNYSQLINAYQKGQTQISHLVGLNITRQTQRPKFTEDKNGNFDTLINTSLEFLENILVAIMFDISLYHYFGLSDDILTRKKFNEVKFKYIAGKLDTRAQNTIYGGKLPGSPIYLPISLPEIKKLDRRIKHESRQEMVREMLNSFATFLVSSSMAIHVNRDNDGAILEPSSSIPREIFPQVEKLVLENAEVERFAILFFQGKDSTEILTPKVLEYKAEGTVDCWIEKESEMLTLKIIVSVRQGENIE